MKLHHLISALLGFIVSTAYAEECPVPPQKHSVEFERLKALEGKWEGTTLENGKSSPVTVTYHVTAGGSAILETLLPGTPHEMVSVYTDKVGKLSMTHYCMIGNQPQLELVSSSPTEISLSFGKHNSMNPKVEDHMHALRMVFIDDNTLVQNWSGYMNGKEKDPTVFKLERAH